MLAQMLITERERVAAAARSLASDGLVLGSAGNVSERAGELVAITPTGAVLERLSADDIVIVDLDGAPVDGELAPTSELDLHLGAYRRYGTGGVVHAHSPFGTALSCVLDEVPVVHYGMLALGGSIRVAPYATFGSAELAQFTLDALQDRAAALMANHGTITIGADAAAATETARLLEWACTVYWRAASLGTPRTMSAEQLQAVVETIAERNYGSPQSRQQEAGP
jgi:L-fuculose-phosphate aldolase